MSNNQAQKIIHHYSYFLNQQIGKGYSSVVFKGVDTRTQMPVAIKVIDMQMLNNPIHRNLLNQEIETLKSVDSVNLMKLYDVFQTKNNTYIVTELCDQGDLAQLIQKKKQLSEKETIKIMKMVLQGLMELHRKGIVHRDIKPANILLHQGVAKIADFGFAKFLNQKEKTLCNVGTPLYMSPEVARHSIYSFKSDIWAFGCMFYELLVGQSPFYSSNEQILKRLASEGRYSYPQNITISNEMKQIISYTLQVDVNFRIDSFQLNQLPIFKTIESPKKSNSSYTNLLNKENLNKAYPLHINRERENSMYSVKSIEKQILQDKNIEHVSGNSCKRTISVMEQANTKKVLSKEESNSQIKLGFKKNKSEHSDLFNDNQEVVKAQINFCRFLYRIIGLLQKCDIVKMKDLVDKLDFLLAKNIQIKMQKLKELSQNINSLQLQSFDSYSKSKYFEPISKVIQDYSNRYGQYFDKSWNQIQVYKSTFPNDKRFDAVLDQNFLEFESFYIILHCFLRQAIKELSKSLQELQIQQDTEIASEHQESIVLLDYLVTYFQLSQLILETLNDQPTFAKVSKIDQIANGRPVKLTKYHFQEIQNKIIGLEI